MMEGEYAKVPEQHPSRDDCQDKRDRQHGEEVLEFCAPVASPALSVVPFLVGSGRAIACSPEPALTTPMTARGSHAPSSIVRDSPHQGTFTRSLSWGWLAARRSILDTEATLALDHARLSALEDTLSGRFLPQSGTGMSYRPQSGGHPPHYSRDGAQGAERLRPSQDCGPLKPFWRVGLTLFPRCRALLHAACRLRT